MLCDPNFDAGLLHRPLSFMLLLNVGHQLLNQVFPDRQLLLPRFQHKNLLKFLFLPLGRRK